MFGRRRRRRSRNRNRRFQKDKNNHPLSQQDSTCGSNSSNSHSSNSQDDIGKNTRTSSVGVSALTSDNNDTTGTGSLSCVNGLSSKMVNKHQSSSSTMNTNGTFGDTTTTTTTSAITTMTSSTNMNASNNHHSTQELISPSQVMPLTLRKLPFQTKQKQGLKFNSSSSSSSSYPLQSSLPAPPTLDSNNDEFNNINDFESFQNTGCNPFQKISWTGSNLSCPTDNHDPTNNDDKKNQTQTKSQLHLASSSSSSSSKMKRNLKFLTQMNIRMRKNKLMESLSFSNDEEIQIQHEHPNPFKKLSKLKSGEITSTSTTNKTHNPNHHHDQDGSHYDNMSVSVCTATNTKNSSFQLSQTPKLTNKAQTRITIYNNGQPQSQQQLNPSCDDVDVMVLTRSALSRPFGRTSLPSNLAKTFCAEVTPFYDTVLKGWKYHILIQREEYSTSSATSAVTVGGSGGVTTTTTTNNPTSPLRNNKEEKYHLMSSPNSVFQPIHTISSSQSPLPLSTTTDPTIKVNKSFTAAKVTRTLKDIAWLERALRDEYQGALIFPALSMTLTSGTDWTTAVTLDKEIFDRGEWDPFTLSNDLLDVVLEEEGFFDLGSSGHDDEDGNGRHGQDKKRPPFDPKLIADWFNDILNGVRGKGELILNYSNSPVVDVMHSEAMESFFYKVNEPLVDLHFMKKKELRRNWLPINLDLTRLPFKESNEDVDDIQNCTIKGLMTFPLLCLNNFNACNLEDFSDDGDSSILSRRNKTRSKQHHSELWHNALLSEELKVQSYYISLQRENTLRAMYRLRILLETEALLSAAWKRFAISLSNLFTAAKDIESCKVGDPKGKKNPPNIGKDKVDNCLRMIARQKVERSTPSLKVLSGMLSAYYADLTSANPSLRAFTDGLKQLEREKSMAANSDDNWRQALKAVSPLTLFQDPDETLKDSRKLEIEMQVFEKRQSFNESLIKSSLLQICNSVGIRVSRMSWKFFKMESGQASLLSHAAEQVQENLSLDSYQNETDEEIHDDDEIELVKRILDLGSHRKFKVFSQAKSCSSSNTGSDHDATSENDSVLVEGSTNDHDPIQNVLVEKVVDQTKNKIGRWDAKLVQTILKAIGVENLEISMENCTREVRTIQRLAESLRAQVDRCDEAILMLEALAYGVSDLIFKQHADLLSTNFSSFTF